ncbi:hypothetical protein [Salinivibrio socompensis]|uniref:hypothetical protein n=1 Tax=Salinivibrio socompensis TaxID=1510206 RepID=UPI00046F0CB3|nr:hypothetical protein [Salinivibrio socompensis]
MMFTVENTARIGRPVSVFDGRGQEITDVVSVDTCSEEVTFIVTDSYGLPVMENNKFKTLTKRVPGVMVRRKPTLSERTNLR